MARAKQTDHAWALVGDDGDFVPAGFFNMDPPFPKPPPGVHAALCETRAEARHWLKRANKNCRQKARIVKVLVTIETAED